MTSPLTKDLSVGTIATAKEGQAKDWQQTCYFVYSEVLPMYLSGSNYIRHSLAKSSEYEKDTNVTFRFITGKGNGVLMYMSGPSDFLVVEMVEGSLVVQMSLGGGESAVTYCFVVGKHRVPCDRSLPAQSINITQHNQENRSPQTFAHLVNFSRNVSISLFWL